MCQCIIPVLRKRFIEFRDGIVILPKFGKCKTFVVQGIGIIRAYRERIVIGRNRFGKAPKVCIGQTLMECS